jgi:putative transposase
VSGARFVADQRTMHRVPHTLTCAILGISISWFHKWLGRGPTERAARRAALDARVRECFEASGRTYGSPRIHADLVEAGQTVSVNTIADSMRRQGLAGRKPKRRRGLTRQDRIAPKFPDLVNRDFSASAPNVKWCGDITEIPTEEGKLLIRCWICIRVGCWAARPPITPMPFWRVMRSRWPWRCAADARSSTG